MPTSPTRLPRSLSALEPRKRWLWAVAIVLVVASTLFALSPLRALVRKWNDFAFIYAAGRTWLSLESPYDIEVWRSHWAPIHPSFAGATALNVHAPPFPFMYPPHWFALATPLGLLSWPWACRTWDLVNVACYFGVMWMLLRLLAKRSAEALSDPWLWILVAVATLNSAVKYQFWDCCLCLLPTLGVVGGFWALHEKRVGWLALCSFVAALKPQVAFLPLLYLLLNGGARGVLLGGAAALAVSVAALAPLNLSLLPAQWSNSYHLHMDMGFNALDNFHSFTSLLAFAGMGRVSLLSPLLGVASIALLTWLRRRAPAAQREAAFDPLSQVALVTALDVAFVPLHSYDLVLLTPVFIWAYTVRTRWLAVGIVAVGAVASRTLDWGIHLGFRPLAATVSVALAAACVVAWRLENRDRVAEPAARAAA